MTTNEIRAIFLIDDSKQEVFVNFLNSVLNKNLTFDDYLNELRKIYCLVLLTSNPQCEKAVELSYREGFKDRQYYLIGCDKLIMGIDIFSHYVYNTKKEWPAFVTTYKKLHNQEFNLL